MNQISRRKFLAATGAALAGSALLAACGPAAGPAPAPTAGGQPPAGTAPTAAATAAARSQPPAGQAVTIDVWDDIGPGPGEDALKKMITDFQEKNPNIKVNRVFKPTPPGTQVNPDLLTAIASGTPPDANRFDRFAVPQFAAQGFLTDITDLANQLGVKK